MKEGNVLLEKSYAFGLRVVRMYLFLRKEKMDIRLCEQVLRSGTSVGANVEEAMGGSSRRDFTNKLQIAYREARETRYWLRLLQDSELLEIKMATSFINDCEELIKLLTTILKSTKNSTNNY